MDKLEVIYRASDGPHEVLYVKEVVFETGALYGILSGPKWLAKGWNPTPSNMLDDRHSHNSYLTPVELDALCSWWLAKRGAPIPVWTEAEIREVFRGEIRVELEQEHYESIVNEIEEEFFHGLSALHAKKGDA